MCGLFSILLYYIPIGLYKNDKKKKKPFKSALYTCIIIYQKKKKKTKTNRNNGRRRRSEKYNNNIIQYEIYYPIVKVSLPVIHNIHIIIVVVLTCGPMTKTIVVPGNVGTQVK